MITVFSILCLSIVELKFRNICFLDIMPKRSIRLSNRTFKKIKCNQDLEQNNVSVVESKQPTGVYNLKTGVFGSINIGSSNKKSKIEVSSTSNMEKVCVEDKSKYNANRDNTKTTLEYLDPPIKSDNDKKEYRVIKLENGLTALLIADVHSISHDNDIENSEEECASIVANDNQDSESEKGDEDEETSESEDGEESSEEDDSREQSFASKQLHKEEKMAACGLCVEVGSFSDPPEIPGMAHFLEHMVFMGSDKYPQENDFDAFIKRQGGSDNASTDCEHTSFYFEIQEKFLLSALDRFAQFFIKPLMKRDAISREREAIESEFQLALPSDTRRKEQLFCSLAQDGHPATKFTWGNLITLRDNITDDKLYKELHKFRERHYSAHRMKLSIQARVPLDTLEKYVIDCFTDVPNNQLPADDFTKFKGTQTFDTSRFRKIYKFKPVKDICKIELTWAMPSLLHLYKSKPHQYISWIIGHEGKGSLISYLRKKMWCLNIYSGNGESGFEHNSMYALFTICLVLTDEGHENLFEVLTAVFSYVNMLKKAGPQKRIYDEIQQIEEINFRFAEEVAPADYVEDLCENMHFYPPEDYIRGNDLFFEYNIDAIQKCLDYLIPDNVNIMIIDKKFNEDEFEKIEPWFKTKYSDENIPDEWIEKWKTIEPLPEFHLPLPNVFLTDDFNLISLPQNISKYPTKIYSDDICEIWYRPDAKFRLPECYIYLHLISPVIPISPQNSALLDVFVSIMKQLLVEELYPATVARLNFEGYTNMNGMVMKFSGFNQKLPLLLSIITKYIANSLNLISENLYKVMKKELLKLYYNTFLKPSKLVRDVRLSILTQVYWPSLDKYAALCDVDFNQFQNFVRHFTNHMYVQCLAQGNITEKDVIKNVRQSIDILICKPLLPNTTPTIRVTKIPVGVYNCKVKNFNSNDVNSVVTNYYQAGLGSVHLSVLIELIIMIMEEPLFNTLRTQEQLGYNVFCMLRDSYGILGYSITVCSQADKYTTEHVDMRIEEFLKSFIHTLENISEEEFVSFKEALIKLKQCVDIDLKEEVTRNWSEIVECKYMYDRFEKEILAINTIKLDELRKWMIDHTMNGSDCRKLSVHVIGTTKKYESDKDSEVENSEGVRYPLQYIPNTNNNQTSTKFISNIEEFKRELYIYPVENRNILS